MVGCRIVAGNNHLITKSFYDKERMQLKTNTGSILRIGTQDLSDTGEYYLITNGMELEWAREERIKEWAKAGLVENAIVVNDKVVPFSIQLKAGDKGPEIKSGLAVRRYTDSYFRKYYNYIKQKLKQSGKSDLQLSLAVDKGSLKNKLLFLSEDDIIGEGEVGDLLGASVFSFKIDMACSSIEYRNTIAIMLDALSSRVENSMIARYFKYVNQCFVESPWQRELFDQLYDMGYREIKRDSLIFKDSNYLKPGKLRYEVNLCIDQYIHITLYTKSNGSCLSRLIEDKYVAKPEGSLREIRDSLELREFLDYDSFSSYLKYTTKGNFCGLFGGMNNGNEGDAFKGSYVKTPDLDDCDYENIFDIYRSIPIGFHRVLVNLENLVDMNKYVCILYKGYIIGYAAIHASRKGGRSDDIIQFIDYFDVHELFIQYGLHKFLIKNLHRFLYPGCGSLYIGSSYVTDIERDIGFYRDLMKYINKSIRVLGDK